MPGEGLGGEDRTCPLLMANILDLWPGDSPALAPADRQQAADVWLSHRGSGETEEEHGREHVAAAGAESPKGTWVLSLCHRHRQADRILELQWAIRPLHPKGLKPLRILWGFVGKTLEGSCQNRMGPAISRGRCMNLPGEMPLCDLAEN